jgi:nicotinamidase-related amidase
MGTPGDVDSDTALIVIDMLNPYEHEHADLLVESVGSIVAKIRVLVNEAREADGVELVYVNDNYEDFTATAGQIVRRALDRTRPDLIEPIVPPDEVDFLQKVRHSAFYSTALDHLLRSRGVGTLVLAGQVTEQCILYTALDAYVRGFDIRVPRDAVAHIDEELADAALRMMERNMRVDVVDASDCLRVKR